MLTNEETGVVDRDLRPSLVSLSLMVIITAPGGPIVRAAWIAKG